MEKTIVYSRYLVLHRCPSVSLFYEMSLCTPLAIGFFYIIIPLFFHRIVWSAEHRTYPNAVPCILFISHIARSSHLHQFPQNLILILCIHSIRCFVHLNCVIVFLFLSFSLCTFLNNFNRKASPMYHSYTLYMLCL